MLCHSWNERCHVGDVGYHLIDNSIKISTVAEVQRGVKGHFTAVEYQLDLKEWCKALSCVCVVNEVLQGAAYCTGEACQDHAVHVVCVCMPITAVQVCYTEQGLVLLQCNGKGMNWGEIKRKTKGKALYLESRYIYI